MARFVPDVKTKRWIIISPVRQERPEEIRRKKSKTKICPFCYGQEKLTPPEITRKGEGEKDGPGWKVRVIPNKYPLVDIHEVIIHSPDHKKNIEDLGLDQVRLILSVYRLRFKEHLNDGQVMIFCNHGEHAGASLTHPHSQLVVIPRQINLEALVREPVLNVIEDNNYFVTYCPDFSQWPYEVWISPKREGSDMFSDTTDDELKDLAHILQRTLRRLIEKYKSPDAKKIHYGIPFAYNYYIYHAKDWFLRIIPRFVHRAGFELGSGLSVNVADPTQVAKELKEIKIR